MPPMDPPMTHAHVVDAERIGQAHFHRDLVADGDQGKLRAVVRPRPDHATKVRSSLGSHRERSGTRRNSDPCRSPLPVR